MDDAATDPWGGLLPADGLALRVSCRTSRLSEAGEHVAVLAPGWRLTVPHDLDAERIAVALGGVCSCVDLADRTVPATRGYLVHRLRCEPAEIEHRADGSWRPVPDVVGCCRGQGFPQARDAAAHLRRPRHWVQRFGADASAVSGLATHVLAALEQRLGTHGLADQAGDVPMPPPPDDAALDGTAWRALWDAGLHPVIVRERGWGEPDAVHSARALLDLVYAAEPAAGPGGGAHESAGGRLRQVGERQAWAAAGVRPATITALLGAEAYSLGDAQLLASRLGRSPAEAADILADWQAVRLTPPVDTLVGVYWGPIQGPTPPEAGMIDETVTEAARRGLPITRLSAALALVRAGTPEAAVAYLADPIRRPDDPYSP